MQTAELAKAAFLQAALQLARHHYGDQFSREETAESTILFNDAYAAAFPGEREAFRAALESTGA